MSGQSLASLNDEQLRINEQLVTLIAQHIDANGPITFAEYMHRCLYEPGLGYYVNGLSKLGADGDFVTAPEISADFANCLALQSAQIFDETNGGSVLEFGGGSGQLACDMLLELERLGSLPESYYLLDVSADLKQLQRQKVSQLLPAGLASRVQWVDSFIENFTGVVIANELFDAFPVQRFSVQGDQTLLQYIDHHQGEFSTVDRDDQITSEHLAALQREISRRFEPGFVSEYCPVIAPWWKSLSESFNSGAVLVCDYGCEAARYYSARRSSGSLRCYFRHQVHADPLIYQGVQDITADVDFTALAGAAVAHGFALEGYTSMTQFMLSLGAVDRHQDALKSLDERDGIVATGKFKQVLLPEEMGERFMVCGFSKNIQPLLRGFSEGDQSRLL